MDALSEGVYPASAIARAEAGPRWRYWTLFLLVLMAIFSMVDKMLITTMLDPIKRDFGLDDTELGLLTGISFSLFFALAGIPLGIAADRGNRRNLIALCISVWSVATMMCGFTTGFAMLLMLRFVVGAGESGATPSAVSMISDLFPTRERARALAIYYLFTPIGSGVGLTLGAILVQEYGWREAFMLAGAPGLLIVAILLPTVREPRRLDVSGGIESVAAAPPLRETLRFILGQRALLHLGAGITLVTIAVNAFGMWMFPFFTRVDHLAPRAAGRHPGRPAGGAGRALAGVAAGAAGVLLPAAGVPGGERLRSGGGAGTDRGLDGCRYLLVRRQLCRLAVAGAAAHAGDAVGDPATAHHPARIRARAADHRPDQRCAGARRRGALGRLRHGRGECPCTLGRDPFHACRQIPAAGPRDGLVEPSISRRATTIMRLTRTLSLTVLALAVSALAPSTDARASTPDLLAKGEYLARAGDCIVCHTGPGEKPFSGGLKMATPLGAITSTNITPDKDTGIGDYSFAEFERAMREGIAKDGHRLYPAMPYPSYGHVSEDDLRALYAFFMERVTPVSRKNSPTDIKWPLNMRWPIAIWDGIFTDRLGFQPDASKDAAWNRGAYLVQGLGHCGACHTPRGIFFQEKGLDQRKPTYLAGANLDDWYASSLRGDPRSGLAGWSEADIAQFLKTGHNGHASAFGTMIDAVNNSTQYFSDEDLAAIATYLKSLPGNGGGQPVAAATPDHQGQKLYQQQCAACHQANGAGHAPYIAPLAGNPALSDPDPASLINITLNGSSRIVVDGMPDAYRMPQFRVLLKDDEIAAIVSYIRESWGGQGGAVTAAEVAKIRKSSDPASDAVVILRMK